ncbi:hypothetical protein NA57DRAFT_65369 [Rhizodiscina lignyota]|uniref:DUF1279 domain-containing protein n=1 Tax=Rhizodiscina lignyota TaxID=1504668 RepID=A0A9P4M8I5_9PEZI|nr:hypothetical protein NA57DRAFT_65369 [Rhizodiscina lignyota]
MRALQPLLLNTLPRRFVPVSAPKAHFGPQYARRSIFSPSTASTRLFGVTASPLWRSRISRAFLPRFRPPIRSLRSIRHNSTSPNPTPHLGSPKPQPSLKDQLKRLFREYGWSAVGVYLLLSAADMPICFLIVRMVGTERVGEAEHAVLEYIRKTWRAVNPLSGTQAQKQTVPVTENESTATVREGIVGSDVAHAQAKAKDGEASIWTQLALAYAIHKSLFIFIRIPLTVAVTPKVVKTLRGWGWEIGKRSSKVPKT